MLKFFVDISLKIVNYNSHRRLHYFDTSSECLYFMKNLFTVYQKQLLEVIDAMFERKVSMRP
jgi:hypothetical protein